MSKKDEQPAPPKHLQDHAPTVIHDPEADQTVLYRWLRRSWERGTSFWLLIGGAALLVGLASVVILRSSTSRTAEAEAWEALILASGNSDPVDLQLQVGEQGLGEASAWALLRAAESRYREGFSDLPQNREAALPLLKEAQTLFERADSTTGADATLRRMSAFGKARTLEALGDLEGAIQQYESLVKQFPDTAEAKRAEELARLLRDPEIIAFYNQFSSFKPEEAILPPGGSESFNIPGLPDLPGFPGLNDMGDLPGLPGLGSGSTLPGTGPIPGSPPIEGDPPLAPPLNSPVSTPEPVAEPTSSDESTPLEDASAPEAPEPVDTPTEAASPAEDELPSNPFPDR